jgi:hypothetical protein
MSRDDGEGDGFVAASVGGLLEVIDAEDVVGSAAIQKRKERGGQS